MKRLIVIPVAVLLALGLRVAPAEGALIDLTTGGTSTINGAIFTTTGLGPTGSGSINSFVRISTNQDVVQGYNTDARPLQFDENNSSTFTRSLLLTAVPIVNINNTLYREFMLDINQTNADPFLSLNEVQIWTRTGGNLTGFTAGGCTSADCSGTGFNSGTKAYGMDVGGDNNVTLNYSLNSGSGSGDLFVYVPDAAFGAGAFVYLYSRFGTPENNNDGYEEWAVRIPGPVVNPNCTFNCPVPEPGSMALLGLGLLGAGFARRRRK